MCGIVGFIEKQREDISDVLVNSLLILQHRGQDAAGVITYDRSFHLKKGQGLVQQIFQKKHIQRLKGFMGIGHVRYPTIGPGTGEDAQPFYTNHPYGIGIVHNGNVMNFFSLKRKLWNERKWQVNSLNDVEVILNVFAMALEDFETGKETDFVSNIFKAVETVYSLVRGAYSVILLIGDRGLLAFKDSHGIRPLSMGIKQGGIGFASESVVFDYSLHKLKRELLPGEAVFVDKDLKVFSRNILKNTYRPCIFEWVYFSRPDSIINGIGVLEARKRLGRALGKKIKQMGIHPDVVIGIPDTGRPAAIEVANELKIPVSEGLIRNRYITRTFIMPRNTKRHSSVRQKLNPVMSEIKDKNVLLVDDSIVRGTTSSEIVKMVRSIGAKKVYYASYSPPVISPCYYGIDMTTNEDFIARDKNLDEVRKIIGADLIIYGELKDLASILPFKEPCMACFNNNYPIKPQKDDIEDIEKDRLQWNLL